MAIAEGIAIAVEGLAAALLGAAAPKLKVFPMEGMGFLSAVSFASLEPFLPFPTTENF